MTRAKPAERDASPGGEAIFMSFASKLFFCYENHTSGAADQKNGQSDQKRNSGSYLNGLLVGQGASEASSLTNPLSGDHPQIVR